MIEIEGKDYEKKEGNFIGVAVQLFAGSKRVG